jgi:hypothetical protein
MQVVVCSRAIMDAEHPAACLSSVFLYNNNNNNNLAFCPKQVGVG